MHDNVPLQIEPEDVHVKFEEKMHEIDLKEEEKRAKLKASQLGVPYINLRGFPINAEALRLIPEELAHKKKVVSFLFTGRNGQLRLAALDPKDKEIQDIAKDLEKRFGAQSVLYLTSEQNLETAFHFYSLIPKRKEAIRGIKISVEELSRFRRGFKNLEDFEKELQRASVTDMVTLLIAGAIESGASDIHIEAEDESIKLRLRIDGVLHDIAFLKKNLWEKFISRIKLLSGVKLNIIDRPQDGRFTIFLEKEEVDVRVSYIPTTYGESVVMRLLMSSAIGLKFKDLGIRGKAYEILSREVKKPNGMIITTGPTGSGKTTTMYAVLSLLNDSETKIITLENPIEYKLKGINQSQVDLSKGYTFSQGLRSVLRQDPDVILVGEIRDLETADTAINAALTGHLVLSTIHTNSASGAIPRFLAMDVKPFLLSPSLNAIIGQRLVRRICELCKEEDFLTQETVEEVRSQLEAIPDTSAEKPKNLNELRFYRGKGCNACQGLGYKGRIGIYEVMTMNQEVNDFIASGKVSEYDLQTVAIKNGMITMVQDGILKAIEGITSISEVFRVAD